MALFGGRKKKKSRAPAVKRAARRAYTRVRKAYAATRAWIGNIDYKPGFLVHVGWGAWGVNQVAAPLFGDGKVIGGAAAAWEANKGKPLLERLGAAWREWYDVHNIRTGGYQPSNGADWSDKPQGYSAWKEIRGPAMTTFADFLVGLAGANIKTGPVRWVGRVRRRVR